MPYRKTPLIKGQIYHIVNRGVADLPIFLNKNDYLRAIEVMDFYRYYKPKLRFSYYKSLPIEERLNFLNDLREKGKKQISLLAFCFMPNHFHFLIKEMEEDGVMFFMKNFSDSYAKYFNMKNKRRGPLFQSVFRTVRIESDDQFLHVSRYIHLNPYSSYLLKEIQEIEVFPYCSFIDYLQKRNPQLVDSNFLMNFFPTLEKFKEFTYNQADYQRKLDEIKHLAFDY